MQIPIGRATLSFKTAEGEPVEFKDFELTIEDPQQRKSPLVKSI